MANTSVEKKQGTSDIAGLARKVLANTGPLLILVALWIILMVSSELPEILGMSDRIMVMAGGRIRGFLTRDEATEEKVMELATATDRELIAEVLPELVAAS